MEAFYVLFLFNLSILVHYLFIYIFVCACVCIGVREVGCLVYESAPMAMR